VTPIDPSALYDLLTPRAGRIRQASSFGRDPERGGDWLGLRPAAARRKRVVVAPGETHVMAQPPNAGLVTRLWMTTLLPPRRRALRDLALRFFWDGEADPSVECPFGDFFGAPFGREVAYDAGPMSILGGGFLSRWPMPYAAGARLEVRNDGAATIDPLYYQVTFYELAAPPGTPLRFHASWRRENPTRPGVPYTVVEARGAGHYVGCHLALQNREWWLRPRPDEVVFPRGFGLGMLEGPERIWVDDEETPSVQGTGTEDYIGGGWYFAGGPFATPDHGCTFRDLARGRVAAYRLDVAAPLPFGRSLRVEFDHGPENRLAADYTSVAYWYQAEPHRALPVLPAAEARRPSSPLANLIQAGAVVGAPALLGLAVARAMRRR
jgi:hypothetical protein